MEDIRENVAIPIINFITYFTGFLANICNIIKTIKLINGTKMLFENPFIIIQQIHKVIFSKGFI